MIPSRKTGLTKAEYNSVWALLKPSWSFLFTKPNTRASHVSANLFASSSMKRALVFDEDAIARLSTSEMWGEWKWQQWWDETRANVVERDSGGDESMGKTKWGPTCRRCSAEPRTSFQLWTNNNNQCYHMNFMVSGLSHAFHGLWSHRLPAPPNFPLQYGEQKKWSK